MSAEKRARVVEILRGHEQEMEGYAYYGSNRGVPKDEYEEIAEEVVTAIAPEWKDISTAPRDGTAVITWHDFGTDVKNNAHPHFCKRGYAVIQKRLENGSFSTELWETGYVTHWLPLPAPPESE